MVLIPTTASDDGCQPCKRLVPTYFVMAGNSLYALQADLLSYYAIDIIQYI